MPWPGNVGWVVQDYETLDDRADQEADAGEVSLPADGCEPAYEYQSKAAATEVRMRTGEVGEDFLLSGCSEFGYLPCKGRHDEQAPRFRRTS